MWQSKLTINWQPIVVRFFVGKTVGLLFSIWEIKWIFSVHIVHLSKRVKCKSIAFRLFVPSPLPCIHMHIQLTKIEIFVLHVVYLPKVYDPHISGEDILVVFCIEAAFAGGDGGVAHTSIFYPDCVTFICSFHFTICEYAYGIWQWRKTKEKSLLSMSFLGFSFAPSSPNRNDCKEMIMLVYLLTAFRIYLAGKAMCSFSFRRIHMCVGRMNMDGKN